MSSFDDKIKDALRSDPIDPPGLIEMAASNFRGRNRLMTLMSVVVGIAFMGVMIWSVVRFFQAEEVRNMILYATLFLFACAAIAMMKLWFWMMMLRYSIVREMKRLELQVLSAQSDSARE